MVDEYGELVGGEGGMQEKMLLDAVAQAMRDSLTVPSEATHNALLAYQASATVMVAMRLREMTEVLKLRQGEEPELRQSGESWEYLGHAGWRCRGCGVAEGDEHTEECPAR